MTLRHGTVHRDVSDDVGVSTTACALVQFSAVEKSSILLLMPGVMPPIHDKKKYNIAKRRNIVGNSSSADTKTNEELLISLFNMKRSGPEVQGRRRSNHSLCGSTTGERSLVRC